MVRSLPAAVALALALPLLSGCLATRDGEAASEAWVRTVHLDLDPGKMEGVDRPEDLLRLAKTTFTYTQLGGELVVAGATVAYTDDSGASRIRPLSDFTAKATLSPGDAVTVGGASFLSPITLATPTGVVAAREVRTAAWLQAMGAPLPLAAAPGGEAVYRLSGQGGLSFSFDRFQAPDGSAAEFRDATFASSASATGSLSIAARPDGPALNLTIEASLSATSHLEATVTVTSPDGSGPAGGRHDGQATVAGLTALRFLGGTLSQVGGGGSVHADATLLVREPGAAGYTGPSGLTHPLVNHTQPFAWSDPLEGQAPPAAVVAFLQQLYGLTLVPGDRFTLRASAGSGPLGGELTYDLSAAARQERTVAGAPVNALKLLGTYGLALRLDGRPDTVRSFAFTQWVDADTFLPLEMGWEVAQTLSEDELDPVRDLLRMVNSEVPLPERLDLQLTAQGSLALTRLAPGLRASAATAIGGASALLLPMLVGGFAMASQGHAHAVPAAPSLSAVWDEDLDRLTVVAVQAPLSYADLRIGADAALRVAVNAPATASSQAVPAHARLNLGHAGGGEPVRAGDTISLCAAQETGFARIELVHEPSNTLLYVRHADLAPCA